MPIQTLLPVPDTFAVLLLPEIPNVSPFPTNAVTALPLTFTCELSYSTTLPPAPPLLKFTVSNCVVFWPLPPIHTLLPVPDTFAVLLLPEIPNVSLLPTDAVTALPLTFTCELSYSTTPPPAPPLLKFTVSNCVVFWPLPPIHTLLPVPDTFAVLLLPEIPVVSPLPTNAVTALPLTFTCELSYSTTLPPAPPLLKFTVSNRVVFWPLPPIHTLLPVPDTFAVLLLPEIPNVSPFPTNAVTALLLTFTCELSYSTTPPPAPPLLKFTVSNCVVFWPLPPIQILPPVPDTFTVLLLPEIPNVSLLPTDAVTALPLTFTCELSYSTTLPPAPPLLKFTVSNCVVFWPLPPMVTPLPDPLIVTLSALPSTFSSVLEPAEIVAPEDCTLPRVATPELPEIEYVPDSSIYTSATLLFCKSLKLYE
ncbi:hypothetical protein WJ63_15350 [Burkholderia pyrrocinia]|nr:hypothetical protein WJ63_15350 [Burkholderia pyrrocinia]